jgi:small redox-active disulfide protein 2
MRIKVLGPGCTNCKTLANRALDAVQQLGIDASVEKVEDVQAIASYGILRTPGLVIDEQVVSYGMVPNVEEIKALILKQSAKV